MIFSWSVFAAGVMAGLVMGLVAMVLNKIKFTTLDLTKYFGALLTGYIAGYTNFIAGFVLHIVASGIFANLYVFILQLFVLPFGMQTACIIGIAHTIFSGMMLPVFDRLNPAVAYNTMRPMGCFASNYGTTATITFIVGHMLYAILVYEFLFGEGFLGKLWFSLFISNLH